MYKKSGRHAVHCCRLRGCGELRRRNAQKYLNIKFKSIKLCVSAVSLAMETDQLSLSPLPHSQLRSIDDGFCELLRAFAG